MSISSLYYKFYKNKNCLIYLGTQQVLNKYLLVDRDKMVLQEQNGIKNAKSYMFVKDILFCEKINYVMGYKKEIQSSAY